MEKSESDSITADDDQNVAQAEVQLAVEKESQEEKATVSTKWKWVWRDICFVAEAVSEDESMTVEEKTVKAEGENTGDVKDVPTSSGVKRKVGDDGVETDQTTEKKAKLSEDLDLEKVKM